MSSNFDQTRPSQPEAERTVKLTSGRIQSWRISFSPKKMESTGRKSPNVESVECVRLWAAELTAELVFCRSFPPSLAPTLKRIDPSHRSIRRPEPSVRQSGPSIHPSDGKVATEQLGCIKVAKATNECNCSGIQLEIRVKSGREEAWTNQYVSGFHGSGRGGQILAGNSGAVNGSIGEATGVRDGGRLRAGLRRSVAVKGGRTV